MFDRFCRNQNIQKVLFFLFIYNKCYGTQLQKLLGIPLTSLQNAFACLEKAKVIISYCERKTKLYQLNPDYPLLNELEQFLKKAYTLLPPEEKKMYSLVQQENSEKRSQETSLFSFWEKLKTIKQFTRTSQSRTKEKKGWNGNGKGDVLVRQQSDTTLIFHERGCWQIKQGQDISFSNIFRWTLDRSAGIISLEHLRHGPDQPIFLFHLTPTSSNILASVDSHLCKEDVYLATIPWDRHSIRLNWRVIGPQKNEELECYYT